MRFLVREQSYERRLAAGKLRYEQDGRPTGATEEWRLTAALDGFRVLRIDLDGRASSGDTFLYHVLLNADGRIEDIRWRFYREDMTARGQWLFEADGITAVRTVNGRRFETEIDPAQADGVFPPSAVGLGLLRLVPLGRRQVWTMDMYTRTADRFMAPLALSADLTAVEDDPDGLRLAWHDQARTIWWEDEAIVRMERPDGLTATAVHRDV